MHGFESVYCHGLENSKIIYKYIEEIMKDEIGEVLNDCKIIENGIIIDPEIIKYQKR